MEIIINIATCSKKGGKCRFNYPKLPLWKTIISQGVEADTPEEKENLFQENEKIIRTVREVLGDPKIIESIISNYNLENENLAEYEHNRKKRILVVLETAGVTEEDYIRTVGQSSRRGVCVVLQRDIT